MPGSNELLDELNLWTENVNAPIPNIENVN